jgi:hypothetical protein
MYPQSTVLVEWKLTAKDINVETPCKIGVMTRYKYKTYASASVTFVNKAELERLVNEGKSFSETSTLTVGEGPVKPYIEVLNQPIVIDVTNVSDQNKGSGIMSFWVENKGGGIIDMKTASSADGNTIFENCPQNKDTKGPQPLCLNISTSASGVSENIMAISADGKTDTIENCMKKHIEKTGQAYSLNFIGKATPKYSCSITVQDSSRIKQETTYQIMADISYYYKFTKELSITVQPKIKL